MFINHVLIETHSKALSIIERNLFPIRRINDFLHVTINDLLLKVPILSLYQILMEILLLLTLVLALVIVFLPDIVIVSVQISDLEFIRK